MSFKVLENSGTLITSTEGVSVTRGLTNQAFGIIKGRLQDFRIVFTSGNNSELTVRPGHIIVQGINLVLENEQVFSVTPTSTTSLRHLICHIVAANEQIQADLELVQSYTYGSLNFSGPSLTGELRLPLATVTVTSSGIQSVHTYIDYIDPGYVPEYNVEEDMWNSSLTHRQGQLSFAAREVASDEPHRTVVNVDYSGFNVRSYQSYEEEDSEEARLDVDNAISLIFKKGNVEHILLVSATGVFIDNQPATTGHLYEHNIVLADNLNVNQALELVTFRLLSNRATAYSDTGDMADLLYARGMMSRATCMTASGRCSTGSFSFVKNIMWADQDDDTGYCESVIIGVYGDSDSDLHYVYAGLDEDDNSPIGTDLVPDVYIHDTVVPIL